MRGNFCPPKGCLDPQLLLKLDPICNKLQKTKKPAISTITGFFNGAATQIRTGDLILTKDALYRLSYSSKVHAPHKGACSWRPRRDLNPRPPA